MADGALHHFGQMLLIAAEAAGHKGGACAQCDGQRVEGGVEVAYFVDAVFGTGVCGRRNLPFGQAVDAVVMDKVGDIHISADGVEKVVAALAIGVTVTGVDDDGQIVIGHFCRLRCGKGAAV